MFNGFRCHVFNSPSTDSGLNDISTLNGMVYAMPDIFSMYSCMFQPTRPEDELSAFMMRVPKCSPMSMLHIGSTFLTKLATLAVKYQNSSYISTCHL